MVAPRLNTAPLLALAQILHRTDQPKRSRVKQLLAHQWIERTPSGLVLTPAGTAALQAGIAEAEAIASTALGNCNEARERGKFDTAGNYLDKSQRYLDLANVLRGKGSL